MPKATSCTAADVRQRQYLSVTCHCRPRLCSPSVSPLAPSGPRILHRALDLDLDLESHCLSLLWRHGGEAVDGRSPTTLVQTSLGQFVKLMNMELHFLDMFNDSPTPTRPCWSLCPPAPHSSIVKVVSMHGAHFHNYISPARPNKGLNSSSCPLCWI